MTAPYRLEGDGGQWADYGVNVGHDVHGDIHIHSPASMDGPYRPWRETESPISTTSHAAVRTAMFSLVRAYERAASALLSAGLMGAGRSNDDID